MKGSVVLENVRHKIEDTYIGASYEVDEAFRWTKSHAGEVELLCTYAPGKVYGTEADRPYIAVQEDDAVYCAVDEYKETGTIEHAIELEALSGFFLFRAKMEYYQDMMYFYGFQKEDGYWTQAGLCLVYPKEYVGTENETILIKVLDEAADSFQMT